MRRLLKICTLLFVTLLVLVVWGCYPLLHSPQRVVSSDRMTAFPSAPAGLRHSVEVRWNSHAVPYVIAESDEAGFFALGAVHAHLRLGQMTLLRHIASGRISELIGPIALDIDHTLRILDFGKSRSAIFNSLRSDTKQIITAYTNGLNWYQDNITELPSEFTVLDIEPEPWEPEDVILISRLAGADLSWLFYVGVLSLPENLNKPEAWREIFSQAGLSPLSFGEQAATALIAEQSRSGSNSLVVSGRKSETGSALIANDPHLGVQIPNFWLLAGLSSPSFQVAGLMIPGTPFVAVGRNPDIGWGGTNMRSISSHLFMLSDKEMVELDTRKETITVRWWLDKNITVRESSKGPIISDAPIFEGLPNLALSWVGHESDGKEVEAFLDASRAANWDEFRVSFREYAVSGQNILYADRQGNIGQLLAYRQPILNEPEATLDLWKSSDYFIERYIGALELPSAYNPPSDFIASANNQPTSWEVPLSFSFGSPERFLRLKELLEASDVVTLNNLKQWQRDTYSRNAFELNTLILKEVKQQTLRSSDLFQEMSNWDGTYEVDSFGAAAYEQVIGELVAAVISEIVPQEAQRRILLRGSGWYDPVRSYIETMTEEGRKVLVERAFQSAMERYHRREWGDLHRMRLQHPFGNIPFIGSRYRFLDIPSPGSNTTLLKSGHRMNLEQRGEPHRVTYGAQARHLSDLSDIDHNYFVLLGGQDGWLTTEANIDQVPLWNKGQYIQIPLSRQKIDQLFPESITIR